MDKIQQQLTALGSFKDWSNYLLVTTVAALGWVAKPDHANICPLSLRIVVGCFGLSVVFAILTLALIPHIAVGITAETKSFYDVRPLVRRFWLFGRKVPVRLIWACGPQHVLFLAGIVIFTIARIAAP